jgi:hypothetical protein
MRKRRLTITALVSVIALLGCEDATRPVAEEPLLSQTQARVIPNQYIVVFTDDVTDPWPAGWRSPTGWNCATPTRRRSGDSPQSCHQPELRRCRPTLDGKEDPYHETIHAHTARGTGV